MSISLLDLPSDVLLHIHNRFLNYEDHLNLRITCSSLNRELSDDHYLKAFSETPSPQVSNRVRALSTREEIAVFRHFVENLRRKEVDLSHLRCKIIARGCRMRYEEPVSKREWFDSILRIRSLTSLSLAGWKINEEYICALALSLKELRVLDISDCVGLTQHAIEMVFKCFPNMHTLKLNNFGRRGITQAHAPTPEYDIAMDSTQHRKGSLSALSLKQSTFVHTVVDGWFFSKCLRPHMHSLRSLDLAGNALGYVDLDNILTMSPWIKTLNLSRQVIREHLFERLCTLRYLEELTLSQAVWFPNTRHVVYLDTKILELSDPLRLPFLKRLIVKELPLQSETVEELVLRGIEVWL